MKQNFEVILTESGSPINLPKLSVKDHLSSQIEEMEGIAERLTEAQKQKRPFAELLNGNFCVGEAHQDISPKRFLIENMSKFKERGFSVLFMEHLAEDHNVDERLSSLDTFHMDNKSSEYNFTNVVRAAQENEIEIVCLEESNDIYHQYKDGPERMVSLNYNAREVIAKKEREFHDDTGNVLKWFAFVGSAHLKTFYGVPGICEIIPNVQDVLIEDRLIPKELSVSISIVRNPRQDMRIESILDDQRQDEGGASEKRDRSSSEEELEGLPYLQQGVGESNSKMKPHPSKMPKPGSPSAESLLETDPSKTASL